MQSPPPAVVRRRLSDASPQQTDVLNVHSPFLFISSPRRQGFSPASPWYQCSRPPQRYYGGGSARLTPGHRRSGRGAGTGTGGRHRSSLRAVASRRGCFAHFHSSCGSLRRFVLLLLLLLLLWLLSLEVVDIEVALVGSSSRGAFVAALPTFIRATVYFAGSRFVSSICTSISISISCSSSSSSSKVNPRAALVVASGGGEPSWLLCPVSFELRFTSQVQDL